MRRSIASLAATMLAAIIRVTDAQQPLPPPLSSTDFAQWIEPLQLSQVESRGAWAAFDALLVEWRELRAGPIEEYYSHAAFPTHDRVITSTALGQALLARIDQVEAEFGAALVAACAPEKKALAEGLVRALQRHRDSVGDGGIFDRTRTCKFEPWLALSAIAPGPAREGAFAALVANDGVYTELVREIRNGFLRSDLAYVDARDSLVLPRDADGKITPESREQFVRDRKAAVRKARAPALAANRRACRAGRELVERIASGMSGSERSRLLEGFLRDAHGIWLGGGDAYGDLFARIRERIADGALGSEIKPLLEDAERAYIENHAVTLADLLRRSEEPPAADGLPMEQWQLSDSDAWVKERNDPTITRLREAIGAMRFREIEIGIMNERVFGGQPQGWDPNYDPTGAAWYPIDETRLPRTRPWPISWDELSGWLTVAGADAAALEVAKVRFHDYESGWQARLPPDRRFELPGDMHTSPSPETVALLDRHLKTQAQELAESRELARALLDDLGTRVPADSRDRLVAAFSRRDREVLARMASGLILLRGFWPPGNIDALDLEPIVEGAPLSADGVRMARRVLADYPGELTAALERHIALVVELGPRGNEVTAAVYRAGNEQAANLKELRVKEEAPIIERMVVSRNAVFAVNHKYAELLRQNLSSRDWHAVSRTRLVAAYPKEVADRDETEQALAHAIGVGGVDSPFAKAATGLLEEYERTDDQLLEELERQLVRIPGAFKQWDARTGMAGLEQIEIEREEIARAARGVIFDRSELQHRTRRRLQWLLNP